jgi:hypothetical protein
VARACARPGVPYGDGVVPARAGAPREPGAAVGAGAAPATRDGATRDAPGTGGATAVARSTRDPRDLRRDALLLLAAATLAALGLRLAVGLPLTGPMVLPDELGHLAQARWLAGGGSMTLVAVPYYHVGYPLLLVPAFAVGGGDPELTWHLVGATNALLGAATVPLLAYLLRRVLRTGRRTAVAAAFVASCYPHLLVVAGQGWAENAVPQVVLLWLVALHAVLRRPAALPAAAVGVAAAAAWSVHARVGLPLLAMTPLVLALAARRRLLPLPLVTVAVATAAAAVLGVHALQSLALQALWVEPVSLTEGALGRLASPSLLPDGLAQLAGMLWNVVVATAGVGVVGALALVVAARRGAAPWTAPGQALTDAQRLTALAALLGVAGTWLLAAAVFSDAHRADHFVYGRYLEGVLPLLLAVGVVGLLTASRRSLLAGAAVAAVLVVTCAGTVDVLRGQELQEAVFLPFNTSGIALFTGDPLEVRLWRATGLAGLAGAALSAAALVRRPVAVAFLLALLLVSTAYTATRLHYPLDADRYAGWSPPPAFADGEPVAIDADEQLWWEHSVYQYWMPGARLHRVDLTRLDRPAARWVVAAPRWAADHAGAVREVWVDPAGTVGLYEQLSRPRGRE